MCGVDLLIATVVGVYMILPASANRFATSTDGKILAIIGVVAPIGALVDG